MPIYKCIPCNYETPRKSNYETHLKSSRCKCKDNCSVTSSITTNDDELLDYKLKIKDLENTIKLRDMEIREYIIKLQLKDEIIDALRQKPFVPPPPPQIDPTSPQNSTKSISKLDFLKKERKHAIPIETIITDYLYNTDYNDNLQIVGIKDEEFVIPKSVVSDDYSSGSSYIVKQICKVIDKLPEEQKPIYSSDKRRHTFFIFTNDGWIKSSETEKIDEYMEKLINASYRAILNAFITFNYMDKVFNNHFPTIFNRVYSKEYNTWCDKAEKSKILLYLINDKENRAKAIDKLKIQLSKEKFSYEVVNEELNV